MLLPASSVSRPGSGGGESEGSELDSELRQLRYTSRKPSAKLREREAFLRSKRREAENRVGPASSLSPGREAGQSPGRGLRHSPGLGTDSGPGNRTPAAPRRSPGRFSPRLPADPPGRSPLARRTASTVDSPEPGGNTGRSRVSKDSGFVSEAGRQSEDEAAGRRTAAFLHSIGQQETARALAERVLSEEASEETPRSPARDPASPSSPSIQWKTPQQTPRVRERIGLGLSSAQQQRNTAQVPRSNE